MFLPRGACRGLHKRQYALNASPHAVCARNALLQDETCGRLHFDVSPVDSQTDVVLGADDPLLSQVYLSKQQTTDLAVKVQDLLFQKDAIERLGIDGLRAQLARTKAVRQKARSTVWAVGTIRSLLRGNDLHGSRTFACCFAALSYVHLLCLLTLSSVPGVYLSRYHCSPVPRYYGLGGRTP